MYQIIEKKVYTNCTIRKYSKPFKTKFFAKRALLNIYDSFIQAGYNPMHTDDEDTFTFPSKSEEVKSKGLRYTEYTLVRKSGDC